VEEEEETKPSRMKCRVCAPLGQVTARPIPVNVKMEPTHKHITIPSSSLALSVTDTVTLTNYSPNTVEYRWQRGSGVFSFPMAEGLLEGNGVQEVMVKYTPGVKPEHEETLVCLVCVCWPLVRAPGMCRVP